MWAFVTSFCTISYFNLSGINGLSWVGMAEMPIHLRLRCTSWFFLSEFKKKKKKRANGNTAGCSPGLRGNNNSGGTAASRTTHLLLFSFRIKLKQCFQNIRLVPLAIGNISVVLSSYLTKQKSESYDKISLGHF